jgi:divalent metal cation (Fe/Co/Zn/Cd) transporter
MPNSARILSETARSRPQERNLRQEPALSRRPATWRFPHCLERAEDLAGTGIAIVIWASAAFAGYERIRKLVEHGHTTGIGIGIAGAAIGILGNQARPATSW